MAIHISPRRELSEVQARELESALVAYYSHPPSDYYTIADQAAGRYSPDTLPFHYHLAENVRPGMAVLEMGCGSAHLCPEVEARGGRYTGLDHSEGLLASNRTRFPNASFQNLAFPLTRTFDLVASLYTIEHVVDPPAYLERLWSACRPGGLIAVICPEFIACESFPQSVFFGDTPRRLREKIQSLSLIDAFRHACEVRWTAPRWKAAARQSAPGSFWINTRPTVLHGGTYSIDADAVHLSTLRDLEWWFRERGAEIVATSQTLPNISAEVLRFNCYILARKPAA